MGVSSRWSSPGGTRGDGGRFNEDSEHRGLMDLRTRDADGGSGCEMAAVDRLMELRRGQGSEDGMECEVGWWGASYREGLERLLKI